MLENALSCFKMPNEGGNFLPVGLSFFFFAFLSAKKLIMNSTFNPLLDFNTILKLVSRYSSKKN